MTRQGACRHPLAPPAVNEPQNALYWYIPGIGYRSAPGPSYVYVRVRACLRACVCVCALCVCRVERMLFCLRACVCVCARARLWKRFSSHFTCSRMWAFSSACTPARSPAGQRSPTFSHRRAGMPLCVAMHSQYAMSVIVGRALPDVRDGLKPVHRRIL